MNSVTNIQNPLKDERNLLRRLYVSRIGLVLESILVGLASGLVVALFRLALVKADGIRFTWYTFLRNQIHQGRWQPLVLQIGLYSLLGLILGWMSIWRPMARGSGIPQLKGYFEGRFQFRWFSELLVKIVSGILGIGAGLSLGREGPSVQIGSYVGMGLLSRSSRPEVEKKFLITAGASAGLAAAFNAPLAGVLFALEELHRVFSPLLLTCTLAASMTADIMAGLFFGMHPVFSFRALNLLPIKLYPWLMLLGIVSAFGADLFKRALYRVQDLYKASKLPRIIWPILPLIASIPLGLYYFDVTGGGHPLIESLTESPRAIVILGTLFIIKLMFTALSYGVGTAGGIFLPLLVCGALLGTLVGQVLSAFGFIDQSYVLNFLILGMAAFFTAVVKAPVTGAVLILEMCGNFNHFGGLMLVCLVAYVSSDMLVSEPVYEVLLRRIAATTEPVPEKTGQNL
ncbi:ClC family H(+)/Cl(-) exchange transporter [Gracilinema caldarium]|uniref:Cl-channel voltage-gated family protein n=1 Tax=Gracilinema caldarium (strain ATCC 51460 / DSM 7334 / H1) TaxID=744872 RepID=F8F195_GRAC1|nr:ClC family H(+)/Cl(-) exchange transporter [Gracilinema caldarium]AEJ18739.1 Cl- channel voltage-gated family protein [Gracilinema caldarium DSM 7334]